MVIIILMDEQRRRCQVIRKLPKHIDSRIDSSLEWRDRWHPGQGMFAGVRNNVRKWEYAYTMIGLRLFRVQKFDYPYVFTLYFNTTCTGNNINGYLPGELF